MQARTLKRGLAVVLLAAVAWAAGQWWIDDRRRDRGQAIFAGSAELPSTLAGHAEPLPRQASRCANCHETRDAAPVAASSPRAAASAAGTYAVRLDRQWLASMRSRHGGPPTRYDTASLCTLLRRGVDPGQVMISTVMPRYVVSDAHCADLHAYLMSR